MGQIDESELLNLRTEIAALRSRAREDDLARRLADREEEFNRRLGALDASIARVAGGLGGVDAAFADLLSRTRSVVAEVHQQGYAIVPKFLDTGGVERLRVELEPLFAVIREQFNRRGANNSRQTFHIHNVLAKTRAADAIAIDPHLRMIASAILGADFQLHAGAAVMSPDPGCDAQGPHRDDASFAALPRPRMPLVLTAAVALDDYTPQNGATRLVPGSHVWPGSRRPAPEDFIACEAPAGSLILWDGALFHAGGANLTEGERRRTLTFNYTRGWLRTQFNQFLSIPRHVVLSLPAALQKDLGYQPSARGLGECDGQDPLDYLKIMVRRGGDGAQSALGPEAAPAARASQGV